MPLQFTCPYCQKSQLVPDQSAGQAFACAHCQKVVKIALAAPAPPPPFARPVAQPVAPPYAARRRRSSMAVYVVVAISVATMATGVTLAIRFWPQREEPRAPFAKAPPKTDKPAEEKKKDESKPPLKKIEPLEPELDPEPDEEPPAALVVQKMGEWYLDGDQPKVRFDFSSLQAKATVKELKIIAWTGDVGAPKPASWRARPRRRGDSGREETVVEFKDGRGTVEVALPTLPKEKVYWLQPMLVDADGKTRYLPVEPWEPAAPPLERRPAMLSQRIEPGNRAVHLSSHGKVAVRDGTGKPYDFKIDVSAELDETIKGDAQGATLEVRYRRVGFEFAQNEIPFLMEKVLGPALSAKTKVKSHWQLDQGGTVGKRVVNLDDVPEELRKEVPEYDNRLAQAFELANLHLPNRELQAMQSWSHQRAWGKATLELTATHEGRRLHQKTDEAYVSLRGTLKDGKDKSGKVEGIALVDLRNGFVIKVELKVETEIVVPFVGTDVQGRGVLEVKLAREAGK